MLPEAMTMVFFRMAIQRCKYLDWWDEKFISDERSTIKKGRILFKWNWSLSIVIKLGFDEDRRTRELICQKSVNSRTAWSVVNRLLIPNFDTIRESWNDFCLISVMFLFQAKLHLKLRSDQIRNRNLFHTFRQVF